MTTATASVPSSLTAIVGDSQVVSDPRACAAAAAGGRVPQHIVEPSGSENVAAVLQFCADHDLAVIPRGSGTKLALGNPPRRYNVALSLRQLNQVWHYEAADLTITVGAGMKLGDLQEFLGRDGLWFPLDPSGGASATIGGILATNASGPLRLRHGAARDMVLGMKVATTEGKLIKSGGRVVKNVAGYDLSKLLIGSYGTLGVIVEASLKLFPRPAGRATWVLEPGTFEAARDLRRRILNSPLDPLRMVLLNRRASSRLQNAGEAEGEHSLELWVEVGGPSPVLERCARELVEMGRSVGVQGHRLIEPAAENYWRRLIDFPALWEDFDALVLKSTLPTATCEQFLSLAQQGAERERVNLAGMVQPGVGIAHLGLWGETLASVAERQVTDLRKAAEDLGGALVVERYLKDFNGKWDVWGSAGDSVESMRKMKAVWDPRGILAPGRFVGGI